MKILIVGAGAVGQVFALRLQTAGVALGFYDQPAVAGKLKQSLGQGGLTLFQTSSFHRRDPIELRLTDYQVVADTEASQNFEPDQIWFTTPSPVYYTEWFREFLRQVPSRRVVCFAPEGGRPEFFPQGVEDRLIFGGTTFMAWQGGPAAGGGREGGVNFWLSPLGIPLSGSKDACREVAQVLKKAGFGATIGKPDSHMQAAVTAVMTAFVAGLELSGWSLGAFRKSPWLHRSAAACREMVLSQLPGAGVFQRALLGTPFLSAGFFLATVLLPVLVPFELEKYLKFHYRKTRDQSLALLNVFILDGKARGLAIENIRILLQGLLDSR